MHEALVSRLGDGSLGIVSDLEPRSRRMIVTFSGLSGTDPVPRFAFMNSLAEIDVKVAMLRDHEQAWYHRGVLGVGRSIDEVADRLRELTSPAEEVVMMGVSMGGYAALLFGALCSCEARAFAPQTFIDSEQRALHRDKRYAAEIEAIGVDLDGRYADLLPLLSRSESACHVYYGTNHRLDALHAERLGGLGNVTLHGFDFEGHTVAKHLRDTGWLHSLLVELSETSPD